MATVNPQRHPESVVLTDNGGFLTADVLHLSARDAMTVAVVDGSGNQVTSFGGGGGGADIQFADNAVSGAAPTGTLSMGWDSANSVIRALKVDSSQHLVVAVSNTSIAVTGTFWQATQPVSGTVSINSIPAGAAVIGHIIADSGSTTAVSGNVTVVQSTGTNLHVVVDTAPTTAVTGTFWQATQPVSGSISVSNFPATQPVSGTVSINAIPAGAAVIGHVIADSGSTTAVTGNVTVIQPTGTNLHVVVDTAPTTAVTGTFWQATQPVSGAVSVTQNTTPWSTQDLATITSLLATNAKTKQNVRDEEAVWWLQQLNMTMNDAVLLLAALHEPYAASRVHARALRTSLGQQPNVG